MKKSFYLSSLAAIYFLFLAVQSNAGIVPSITTPPANDTVCSGSIAKFFVIADNSPTGYQWFYSVDAGSSWLPIPTIGFGGFTPSMDTLSVAASNIYNNYLFACTATNTFGPGTMSTAGKLTVDTSYVASIAGAAGFCAGTTLALTDVTNGGTWSSTNLSVATINVTGTVTGVAAGTDTIKYTITNTCGTNYVSQSITIDGTPVIAAISGGNVACTGSTLTLTEDSTGGTWSNLFSSNDTISTSGVVYGLVIGIDTISYSKTNGCGTTVVKKAITIQTFPVVSTISGITNLCAGTTTTLANDTMGGVWSSMSSLLDSINSSGIVHAIAHGTDTVRYMLTNGCGTAMASIGINIDTLPTAIIGASQICLGAPATLSNSISGGEWSNLHSTIDSISNTGIVTPLTLGLDTIKYKLVNSCGTDSVSFPVAIITIPTVSAVTGTAAVCVGSIVTLSDLTAGGTWTSLNSSVDTIGGMSGILYGITHGTDTVKYSVMNICGTTTVHLNISVDTLPGNISGMASSVCVGSTLSLTDSIGGGTWSISHSAYDSISNTGVVHGIAVGLDTVKYNLVNSCGTHFVKYPISIINVPTVGSILGSATVCAGSTISMSDATGGGVWSTHNIAIDSISISGVLRGLSRGNDTVYYAVTNMCGTTVSKKSIRVDSIRIVGAISGVSGLCVGSSIVLHDTTVGGTWTRSNSLIDTVHGGTYGIVTGLTAGNDIISYSVTNSCGTNRATFAIRVDTINAGIITGTDTLCAGSITALSESAIGGIWSSLHNMVATVDTHGIVTAVSAGSDSIVYTVANYCGTKKSYHLMYIKPLAVPGSISGSARVCVGSHIKLVDTNSNGIWTNTSGSLDSIHRFYDTTALISDSIYVYGLAAGVDTIMYSVSNTCGTVSAKYAISVDTLFHSISPIAGPTSLCLGATITLTETPTGGTWSSSLSSIASIDAYGHVTGIPGSTASNVVSTITYHFTNACGSDSASVAINVYTLPNVGTISGSGSVCAGSSVTLTESVSGGAWSVSNGNGTISGGIFSALTAGWDTISYAVSNAHCSASAHMYERIDSIPAFYPTSGPSTVCVGSTITFMNPNTAGEQSWSVSNSNASIASNGILTGLATGIDTIFFNFTNACGSVSDTLTATIQSPVIGGSLFGPNYVCQGSSISMTDTAIGGVWLSSNAYVASVDGPGLITGRHPGSAVISYSIWNSCGSAYDTATINVYGVDPIIIGLDSVGTNFTRTYTCTVSGGIWYSSAPTIASIDSITGKVTGLTVGIDTIIYKVTNPCGTSIAKLVINIGNPPTAGSIFGPDSLCAGLIINLADTLKPGGVWSASNSHVTVSATGIVTGVTTGVDTIYYSITTGFGTGKVSKKLRIVAPPVIHIHYYPLISLGGHYPLLDTPANGTWWSSDSSSITFAAQNMFVLNYTHKGTDTLVYTVTNMCGTTSDTIMYFLPFVGVQEITPNPNSSIKVFPNPNQGAFTIGFMSDLDETAHVMIYNIVGQVVNEFTVNSNRLTEITLDQPNGMYFLKAETTNARFDIRILVNKL